MSTAVRSCQKLVAREGTASRFSSTLHWFDNNSHLAECSGWLQVQLLFCPGGKMPLANFPVKSRTPNRVTEFKLPPQQAKRDHRGARIYEAKSPSLPRPEAAFIQDRPAPILALPGLPPSPVIVAFPVQDNDKSAKGFAKKMLKTGKACAFVLFSLWNKNLTFFYI